MHVETGHLSHRIRLQCRFIPEMFIAIKQDTDLRTPVPQVIVGNDLVSEEAQNPAQCFADNRAADVSDMEGLGDVRGGIIDHVG